MILGHLLTFSEPLSHDIWKNEIRKECANSLCLPNTVLSLFLWVFQRTGTDFGEDRKGIRAVHGWYLESFSGDLKREREVDWIKSSRVCVCVCVRACGGARTCVCAFIYVYIYTKSTWHSSSIVSTLKGLSR